jgi:uncharacterized protein YdiU (UPF0061 family)
MFFYFDYCTYRCMWSGGGDKYSFRNQHLAGERNFFSLATALAPLMDQAGKSEITDVLIPSHLAVAEKAINDIYCAKLGLFEWTEEVAALFEEIDALMEATEVDYTMFWRQLSSLPGEFIPSSSSSASSDDISGSELMGRMTEVFYHKLSPEEINRWSLLLHRWLKVLQSQVQTARSSSEGVDLSGAAITARMCRVNPKYVPREWMLVEAYQAAAQGNHRPLKRLQDLFETPYDEHTPEDERDFYRKMPIDLLDTGGVTTMT